jgi:protein-S-isoprenylcysteine O-methyltransferase Ste14
MPIDFRIISTAVLVVLIFVLPLLPKPELLCSWPVLISVIAGIFLNVSQPPILPKHLTGKSDKDRRSVLAILIAGALTFVIPLLDFAYGRQARPPFNTCWSYVGLLLVVGGLAFRYWAIRVLGRFFTSTVEVKGDQTVIQSGPYRYLRHPSYLGTLVMAVGVPILFRSYIGIVFSLVGFGVAYAIRITAEEKALVSDLGQPYADYQKRTWRLIPFVF